MSNPSKHPNSRIITIFRAGSILSRSQGAAVDDFFASSKQSIGSYFDSVNSQKVGSGLSFSEEVILLPLIIDVPSDDKEFRKKLTEFYADLTTPIPHGTGIQLEIGLETDNTKDIKAPDAKGQNGNMPINLMDFIRYRHARRHPWVATTKEEAEGDQTKQFYIFDKTNVQAKNSTKVKEMDAAMQIYLKVKNDLNTVDQMLTLLGTDPRTFTGKQKDDLKIEALRDKVTADPKKFSEVYEVGELEIRYMLQTMITTKVVKKIGSRIMNAEDDSLIGNTEEEAIWWFKDDTHSESVVVLKARMQEAMVQAPAQEGVRRTQVKAK